MPAADDDSLSWGGDTNDPSYLDGARRAGGNAQDARLRNSAAPDPAAAEAAAAHDPAAHDPAAHDPATHDPATHDPATPAAGEPDSNDSARLSIGSALLVVYGILAGINVFYVLGWVLAYQRETFAPANPFLAFMYELGHVLAIASPVVSYGTVLWLTRHSRAVVRLGWLLLGILLLAPWPFILSGAVR